MTKIETTPSTAPILIEGWRQSAQRWAEEPGQPYLYQGDEFLLEVENQKSVCTGYGNG